MKKLLILISVSMITVFGFTSPLLAGGDKVLACHVTSYNADDFRYEGHVISIPESAIGAHCSHGLFTDHFPGKVFGESFADCEELGLVGKKFDKCVTTLSIGQDCGRDFDNDTAVANLCGD